MNSFFFKGIPPALARILLIWALFSIPQHTASAHFSISEKFIKDLDCIAKEEKSINMKIGAMCYVCVDMDEYKNYICPKCKKATKYDEKIILRLNSIKRQFKALKGVIVEIDDTAFCSHCNPGKPKLLRLSFTFPDKNLKVDLSVTPEQAPNVLKLFTAFTNTSTK
ncbi:MAG: hypothetical protein JXA60_08785 [Candidatus Coatesbacteria bacterium]|nr:hypothetical protein [Candidatus Coatesbacteria bacterium]